MRSSPGVQVRRAPFCPVSESTLLLKAGQRAHGRGAFFIYFSLPLSCLFGEQLQLHPSRRVQASTSSAAAIMGPPIKGNTTSWRARVCARVL